MSPGRTHPLISAENFSKIASEQMQQWGAAECKACQHRHNQSECQHTSINLGICAAGQFLSSQIRKQPYATKCNDYSQQPAQDRNRNALGQELPAEAPSPRTQAESHCQFFESGARSYQHEICQVYTSDEQHTKD